MNDFAITLQCNFLFFEKIRQNDAFKKSVLENLVKLQQDTTLPEGFLHPYRIQNLLQ